MVATNNDGDGPPSTAVTATPMAAPALTPPAAQTIPASFTFAPPVVPVDRTFRLLFVTTQNTAATSANIATYNTFVQDSAAGGHSAISPFSSEFRAVIATEAGAVRDNRVMRFWADSGVV